MNYIFTVENKDSIAGFNLPNYNVNAMSLAWTHLEMRTSFFEIGVQYGPPACGRRSILDPNFSGFRSAFADASSPDSRHCPSASSPNSKLSISIDTEHMLQLGMKHDFDHRGTNCNNKGIMSYGTPPDTWSTCSVSDFKKFWRSIGFSCDLPTGPDPQPPTTVSPPTGPPPTGRPPTGDPSGKRFWNPVIDAGFHPNNMKIWVVLPFTWKSMPSQLHFNHHCTVHSMLNMVSWVVEFLIQVSKITILAPIKVALE